MTDSLRPADAAVTRPDQEGNRLARPDRHAGTALAGICAGFFVVLFDATAVNVATGDIRSSWGASLVTVQWVLNAYTVTFAALMLTAGGLGDRWGSRRVYLLGLGLFTVSSAACALAPNVVVLIVARAVQGVGAAAVVPCSLALIVHRYPEGGSRARALGVWGGVSGIGLAAGPALGGFMVSALGWRAVFLVVIPVAVVSTVAVSATVSETAMQRASRPDPAGQVLAIVALVCLTAAITLSSVSGWAAPLIWSLLAGALVGGSAFVAVERRVEAPMLPLELFRSRSFAGAVCVGGLFNFSLYGVLFCLALVLEVNRSVSAVATGLALMPLTVVVALGAVVSGRLSNRWGSRVPMMIGLSGGLLGCVLLAVLGDHLGTIGLAAVGCIVGVVGVAMPAMTGVALNAVAAGRAGLAAGVLNAARQCGGALGIALLGGLADATAPRGGPDGRTGVVLAMSAAAVAYLAALVVTLFCVGRPSRADSVNGPRVAKP